MKPHIALRHNVWACFRRIQIGRYNGWFPVGPIGHGYNPKDAYADWRAQA